MSSSPSEKKSSDVEMGEANSALPTPAMHEATPTFVAGFLSFKERLSRRSAEKEGGRIQPEVPAILSSPAMSTSAGGNKSPGDATPLAESAECTLTPCSGETEGQGPMAEEGGDVASGRGNDEAAEGGDGCEVEDEGGARRSA
ncbi:hypothetical protein F2Q69_00029369 [Brassica cretica]|uniref:Uncharacterized protein n=1 Tax=Brassica cretica TaxID=69181 RepID=A0A8S9RX52_BRACR|nr:hypothetical protein F2Q69_00029369 [Brassica cretica]